MPDSVEEKLRRLRKRVDLEDPQALLNLAMNHGEGNYGLKVDQAKCIELMRQSAGLGFPPALYQLGTFHYYGKMGLQQNEEEALKYFKEAAECGDLDSLHNFGSIEAANGDHVAAMRHWRLSAPGGYRISMEHLIQCFEAGFLQHEDLAETLQAFYLARAEMKSEDRAQYIKHLKMTGKYEEKYDL
jgi:TPR repeat protein